TDGTLVRPDELAILAAWYLDKYKNVKFPLYRSPLDTAVLDALAAHLGVPIEEFAILRSPSKRTQVRQAAWNWHDVTAQALLAAPIVETTGRSLRENLESIYNEVGRSPQAKAAVPVHGVHEDRIEAQLTSAHAAAVAGDIARRVGKNVANVLVFS